jgi:hypothetical protein
MKRLLLAALLVMLCVTALFVLVVGSRTPTSRLPSNIEHELRKHRSGQTPVILYHGGPVMISGKSLYVIYYAPAPLLNTRFSTPSCKTSADRAHST